MLRQRDGFEELGTSGGGFFTCCSSRSDREEQIVGEEAGKFKPSVDVCELFPLYGDELKISLSIRSHDSICPSFLKSEEYDNVLRSSSDIWTAREGVEEKDRQKSPKLEEEKCINQTVTENIQDNKENVKAISTKHFHRLINKKFSPEEDCLLEEYVKIYGEGCWTKIADQMPGRNRKQLRERYIRYLKKDDLPQIFTKEEDSLILRIVKEKGRKWKFISSRLKGKTANKVKNYYYSKLQGKAQALSRVEATSSAFSGSQRLTSSNENQENNNFSEQFKSESSDIYLPEPKSKTFSSTQLFQDSSICKLEEQSSKIKSALQLIQVRLNLLRCSLSKTEPI